MTGRPGGAGGWALAAAIASGDPAAEARAQQAVADAETKKQQISAAARANAAQVQSEADTEMQLLSNFSNHFCTVNCFSNVFWHDS